MPSLKTTFILIFSNLLLLSAGCNRDEPEPTPLEKEQITLVFNTVFEDEPFIPYQVYQSNQGNDLWISKKKYYVSNIVAIMQDGSKNLISEIALINADGTRSGSEFSGTISQGKYVAIAFDIGVRQDLNSEDPSTYPFGHALSVSNNMYWDWSSQYVFAKIEGFEVQNEDTSSFVIHTGTSDLYRPNITVNKTFNLSNGPATVQIEMDISAILNQRAYAFDLTQDGQSHTLDNLPLAVHYMDNFTQAFQ